MNEGNTMCYSLVIVPMKEEKYKEVKIKKKVSPKEVRELLN